MRHITILAIVAMSTGCIPSTRPLDLTGTYILAKAEEKYCIDAERTRCYTSTYPNHTNYADWRSFGYPIDVKGHLELKSGQATLEYGWYLMPQYMNPELEPYYIGLFYFSGEYDNSNTSLTIGKDSFRVDTGHEEYDLVLSYDFTAGWWDQPHITYTYYFKLEEEKKDPEHYKLTNLFEFVCDSKVSRDCETIAYPRPWGESRLIAHGYLELNPKNGTFTRQTVLEYDGFNELFYYGGPGWYSVDAKESSINFQGHASYYEYTWEGIVLVSERYDSNTGKWHFYEYRYTKTQTCEDQPHFTKGACYLGDSCQEAFIGCVTKEACEGYRFYDQEMKLSWSKDGQCTKL